jgi:hypothetical protein
MDEQPPVRPDADKRTLLSRALDTGQELKDKHAEAKAQGEASQYERTRGALDAWAAAGHYPMEYKVVLLRKRSLETRSTRIKWRTY